MIKKFPKLDKIDDGKKPDSFPIKIGHLFKSSQFNSGFRMTAYESLDGSQVLRVPKKSEGELCELYDESESNVVVDNGDIHSISEFTFNEIRRYRSLVRTLRNHVVKIYFFHGLDNSGELRTFSIQRKVDKKLDLGSFSTCFSNLNEELNQQEKENLKNFIVKIKLLIKRHKLVPDIANRGNLVLEEDGRVSLIDINNIRDLLTNEEWIREEYANLQMPELMRVVNRVNEEIREVFHPDHLDEYLFPIADKSISKLKALFLQ